MKVGNTFLFILVISFSQRNIAEKIDGEISSESQFSNMEILSNNTQADETKGIKDNNESINELISTNNYTNLNYSGTNLNHNDNNKEEKSDLSSKNSTSKIGSDNYSNENSPFEEGSPRLKEEKEKVDKVKVDKEKGNFKNMKFVDARDQNSSSNDKSNNVEIKNKERNQILNDSNSNNNNNNDNNNYNMISQSQGNNNNELYKNLASEKAAENNNTFSNNNEMKEQRKSLLYPKNDEVDRNAIYSNNSTQDIDYISDFDKNKNKNKDKNENENENENKNGEKDGTFNSSNSEEKITTSNSLNDTYQAHTFIGNGSEMIELNDISSLRLVWFENKIVKLFSSLETFTKVITKRIYRSIMKIHFFFKIRIFWSCILYFSLVIFLLLISKIMIFKGWGIRPKVTVSINDIDLLNFREIQEKVNAAFNTILISKKELKNIHNIQNTQNIQNIKNDISHEKANQESLQYGKAISSIVQSQNELLKSLKQLQSEKDKITN